MTEWSEMSAEDQRSILLSLVTHITVKPVIRHGYNRFDSDRIDMVFRSDAIDRISHRWNSRRAGGSPHRSSSMHKQDNPFNVLHRHNP